MALPLFRLRQAFTLASILLATEILLNLMGSAAMAMTLTSPAFTPNGHIPSKYTCEGDDLSPPLAWNGVPGGTKSLVLIIDDPDAPDPKAPQRVGALGRLQHSARYQEPARKRKQDRVAARHRGWAE